MRINTYNPLKNFSRNILIAVVGIKVIGPLRCRPLSLSLMNMFAVSRSVHKAQALADAALGKDGFRLLFDVNERPAGLGVELQFFSAAFHCCSPILIPMPQEMIIPLSLGLFFMVFAV